jgi:dimethylhistidine N-methyltransferase
MNIAAPTPAAADTAFLTDVLAGLAQPQKAIPARWFYDRRGSELFEKITQLPEYYPTRTEIGLLEKSAPEVAAAAGRRAVVEFGSGSSRKTPLLLRAMDVVAYVPIDISGAYLRQSAKALAKEMPGLEIVPTEGDFTHRLDLPPVVDRNPVLGFFPGSTIGNFAAPRAVSLLQALGETLGEDSLLFVGIDRMKPVDILIRAYDDAEGLTAAFNLNILYRINAELEGDIPIESFRHEVRWNGNHNRIEMHLRAERDVRFHVHGSAFSMKTGETIHTENSHKYSAGEARLLLRAGGWTPVYDWCDRDNLFGLYLARRTRLSIQD